MRATPAMRRGPVDRARRRPSGRLSSHPNWTDRRGLVKQSKTYTSDGKVGSTTDANSDTSTSTYGANGGASLTGTQSPMGATTSMGYSTAGGACTGSTGGDAYQPKCSTSSDQDTSTYSYDGAGNTSTNGNQLPATAQVHYRTSDNQVDSSTDPLGRITTYNYSPDTGVGSGTSDILSSIAAPSGSQLGTRNLTFDSLDRLLTSNTGGTTITTNSYDGADRILTQNYSDTAGVDITNSYDENGNLTSRVSNLFGGKTTSYSYDWLNRLIQQTDPDGTVLNYTYDAVGNLTQSKQTAGTQIRTTSYTYDVANNLTTLTEPGGNVDVFRYDNNNRRIDTWNNATGYTVDATNKTVTTAPTGFALHSNAQIDKAGRLTRLKTTRNSSDTSIVTDFSYCHSSLTTCPTTTDSSDRGKIQWEKDNVTSVVTKYAYDHAGRLLTADNPATTGTVEYTYTYDSDGNRTSALTPAGTSYAAFDIGNGLCRIQTGSGPACPTDGDGSLTSRNYGGVFGYDGSGNQTLNPSVDALTYNGADMTSTMGLSSGTQYSFTYAGSNQVDRASTNAKTAPDPTGTTTTFRFGLTGLGSTAIGAAPSAPGYIRDTQGGLIGTYTDNGSTATTSGYYASDGKGNIVALVSAAGSVTAQYRYDPYGNNLTAAGLTAVPANSYGFKGEYKDANGL